mmetsp:Transcript_20439/g.38382  ORF Transcript_20439/g.38382 Transcript_20439/m.38382 type:complete len:229 (-) Transcript_20439:26-712(-)
MADCTRIIAVLGAPTTAEGKPGPDLKQRLDRCLHILENDPTHESSLVAVTGGNPKTYGSAGICHEAICMKQYLVEHGVPLDRIIVEDRAVHTFHNALYLKTILREQGIIMKPDSPSLVHLVVLTTDWHVERGMLCFASVFSDVPNVKLANPEIVPSDCFDAAVVARKVKEKRLIERWIPLCFEEEAGHQDMPDVPSAITAMEVMKTKMLVQRQERKGCLNELVAKIIK